MAAQAQAEEAEEYILRTADERAPEGLDETDTISQVLYWIGFVRDADRNRIIQDSLESYNDIKMLSEKDVTAMAEDYQRRIAAERIVFGARRNKLTKALTHWIHDFYRVSETPTVDNMNQQEFRDQLLRALARAEIRNNIKNGSSTAAEAATPGPLESEKEWKQWEERFTNYAQTQLGSNGVPLSYVIRENDTPDITPNEPFPDFISKTISCAPLNGEYFEADKRTVFNMLVSFTTGKPSADWIKTTLRYSNGRRSMQALRAHFAGEGNASRNKADADRLKESLHYRNERSMSFEVFLTNCQKMFNIYEQEGEPMADDAKTRFLFKKIQHSGLQTAIAALRVQMNLGAAVTYTMAANHLSTAVSELPEHIAKNRNVSGIGTNEKKGSPDIYNEDGSINTGHIPNWRNLSKQDRDIVMNERKRRGTKGGKKNGKGENGNGAKNHANHLQQLTANNNKFKRQIKALKRKLKGDDDTATTATSNETDDEILDAGDQMGGRNSKKRKNESSN
jgi:hypothetical protein